MNLTVITAGLTLIIIGLLVCSILDSTFADYLIISGIAYILYNTTNEQPILGGSVNTNKQLKIYSCAHSHNSGIIVDSELLTFILGSTPVYTDKQLIRNADIIIHLERITPGLSAKYHVWIPNQELISTWCDKNKYNVDLILCKSHKTVDVITNLYKKSDRPIPPIIYTSFTSMCDKKLAYTPRKKFDETLVVLSASSVMKNVDLIIDIWLANDCFKKTCKNSKLYIIYGMLFDKTFIRRYVKINTLIHNHIKNHCGESVYNKFVDDLKIKNKITIKNTNITLFNKLPYDEYTQILNKAGIVLCCSLAEGFGHYINESKYYGNLILTTDAPPMNELITLPELCVKATSRGSINDFDLRNSIMPSPAYGVDPNDFAKKFISLYNTKNKSHIREKLYDSYIQNDKFVRKEIKNIFKNIKLHNTTTIPY